MAESASGARDRRKSETSARLVAEARRLFSERGLSGFTVEEVCEGAGVSRRTFFNYFAAKEDAVLGISGRDDDDELDDRFLAGGDPSADGVSATLFDDFVQLLMARWGQTDFDVDGARGAADAIRSEPRLLARMLDRAMHDEAVDIALVERREGLRPGDLRAAAVVQIVGAIARPSVMAALDPGNTTPLDELLRDRIAAARAVIA